MPTIIDSLIMTLDLKAGTFNQDQEKAQKSLKKTKDQASDTSKELENRAKRSIEAYSKFRNEVIALFAAFTAGVGIKNFVEDTVKSEANLGRMSHALDMSTESLSAWQGVLKRNGGTAEDATGAFRALADIIAEIRTTGTTGKGGLLTAMGVTGGAAQLNDKVGTLMAMADKASHMDPVTASYMLRQIGFSEAMVNVMLKGKGALLEMLEAQKKLGVTTDADVKAAQALQDSLEGLKTASARVGAMILTALEPAINLLAKGLQALASWAQNNQLIVIGALGALTAALVVVGIAAAGAALAASPLLVPLLTVSGIALAAGAALGVLYEALTKGFHAFMDFLRSNKQTSDAMREVGGAASDLWATIKDLFAPLKPIFDAIRDAVVAIEEALQQAFGSANLSVARTFVSFLVNQFHALADLIKAITALLHGDFKGALASAKEYVKDTFANPTEGPRRSSGTSAPATAPASSGKPSSGPVLDQTNVVGFMKAKGFSDAAAQGIDAGVHAESRGDPNIVNPKSGAFGIGQWLGKRKAELFRRYGDHPTMGQQLEFLAWELNGGDHGGKAVRNATTPEGALNAYITKFMRPAKGAETTGDLKRGATVLAANGNLPSPMARYGGAGGDRGTTVNIDTITVHTQAKDADGIARDLGAAMRKQRFVTQVNNGLG